MSWSPEKELLIRVLESLKETTRIMAELEYFDYSEPLQQRGAANILLIQEIEDYLRKTVDTYGSNQKTT